MSAPRRRLAAAALGVITVVAGLAVHALLPDSVVTDVAGDALYALLIVLGVIVVAPRMRSLAVGAIALVWCAGVEIFQLSGLPVRWAEHVPPVALVFGTGFDARDLLVYAASIAVAVGVDALVRRRAGVDRRAFGQAR